MDYLLITLILILLTGLIWLLWRYTRLRHKLDEYEISLRNAAGAESPAKALPQDAQGLEGLYSALLSLFAVFETRLENSDADRARLATVLEQMTDGVIIASPEGIVQFANPAAEKLFGLDPIGRSIPETLRHHQLIQTWQSSQDKEKMQIETVELPGNRQFIQLIVIPDRHVEGGSLLLIQDLTRVRRLENVRRDFISNISHELRTPLASLKALTETLQDGAVSDPQAAPRFLGRIATEVDALTQMAQELLDLSRIESGQVVLELRKVSPQKLIASAAERMRLQIDRAGLSLKLHSSPGLPKINADSSRLEQVLVNLIHNAVKFTPPGGEISLTAVPMPQPSVGNQVKIQGTVKFAVSDTGVGIPQDDLPRIFERFYKSDRARSSGGTGLGLSISKHLIEAHGGRIWAVSEEGRGSTFYFSI